MGKYPRTRANRQRIAPFDEKRPIGVIEVGATPVDEPCEYAKKFTQFATLVLDTIANTRQLVYVNRAKILLTDQYFRIRRTLPIYHQDTTTYDGHPCLYQAFVSAYEELETRELDIAPPAIDVPTTPRARSRRKPVPEPDLMDAATINKLILGE